ncbi:protein sisterless A [Drosophila albomicans]|uniref:Protein sisterless A n=1 Tax=Drosophila albomicans TaxID=7291 RepID=A0A6P8WIL5_DROAB|nr:protein sisterless A [Drosophila albomicans]
MEQSNLYKQPVYTYYPSAEMMMLHPLPMRKPSLMQYNNTPEQIDQMVEQELQLLKSHYANEEQRYVDQMLIANPITVERRPPATRPEETTETTTITTTATPASSRDVQRQRAESCRKSRYNNKIKKAKLRFRHKYACNQLTESTKLLSCMRDVIAQAEAQLLARGFNRAALERMRHNFGVDRCGDAPEPNSMMNMNMNH